MYKILYSKLATVATAVVAVVLAVTVAGFKLSQDLHVQNVVAAACQTNSCCNMFLF